MCVRVYACNRVCVRARAPVRRLVGVSVSTWVGLWVRAGMCVGCLCIRVYVCARANVGGLVGA